MFPVRKSASSQQQLAGQSAHYCGQIMSSNIIIHILYLWLITILTMINSPHDQLHTLSQISDHYSHLEKLVPVCEEVVEVLNL